MAKQVQVVITANANVANKVMKQMEQNVQRTLAKMNALSQVGKQNTKAFKELKKEFDAYNNAIRQNVPDMTRVDEVMKNLAGTTTRDLRRALAAAKREMSNMSADNPQLKITRKKMQDIQRQIEMNTRGVTKWGQALHSEMRHFLSYASISAVLTTITSKFRQLVSLNLEFSDRLADIRKVSGLAMQDINNLSNRLAKIDTRTSIQELNKIAYAGAKLGMGNYGTEGLEGFVKAANQVNVALKEDLGEDALTALSKITENMGLIKSMGIEQAMLKTGSAMFKLASTSTATANNIVEFSKRLTAMAGTAGITTDQLLALGSASDAMFLSPEVSATAFSKLITSLQTKHNLIEKELQLSPGTINNLFTAGKAMDAIVLIFEKMHERGNMNALGTVFKDLGSDGARLVTVMTSMARNVDMLKTHLYTSKEAFKEGTAVTAEYNIQQDTANGIMERANNIWMKAFVNPEGVDMVKEMAQAWYSLSSSLTSSPVFMAIIKLVMQEIATVAAVLLRILPVLIQYMLFYGVAAVLSKVILGYRALVSVIQAATWAQRALNLAQKANLIGLLISLFITLVAYIASYVSSTDDATKSQLNFNSSMRDFNVEVAKASHELDGYRRAIDEAKMGSNKRAAAIKNFNSKFGAYLSNLLTEKSTMQDVARAYDEAAKAIRNKIAVQMQEKELEQVVGPRIQWEGQWGTRFEELTRRRGKGQYNYRWLTGYADDNKNLGMQALATDLGGKIGLDAASIKNVWDTFKRGDTLISRWSGKTKIRDTKESGEFMYGDEYILLSALKTISQRRSVNYYTNKVKNKYAGYINEPQPMQEDPGTLDKDAEDKEAKKKAKADKAAKDKEARERKKAKQDALKAAEEDSTAIISNIEEYYNLQEATVNDLLAEGKIDEHKMKSMLLHLKKQRNAALQQARLAISGQDNTWDDFKMNKMGGGVDMANFSDQSKKSLKELRKVDTKRTYETLARFDGGKDADGVDSGAFLDSIRKKAADNEREVSKANADLRIKLIDMLQQYDAVAQTESYLAESLTQMGILAEDNSKTFKRLEIENKSGIKEKVEGIGSMQELEGVPQLPDQTLPEVTVTSQSNLSSFGRMFQQFLANGSKPYFADMDSTKGAETWLKNFASNYDLDEEGEPKQLADWTYAFPDIEKWLDNVPEYKKEIQAFYFFLLQAEDKYYEDIKKESDRKQKIFDSMWERSEAGKSYTRNINDLQEKADADKVIGYRTPMQKLGLADAIEGNPEIDALELEMEMQKQKLEAMKATNADETRLSEQRKAIYAAEKAYVEKVVAEIDERINKLKEFIAPIEELGSAVGEALGKMSEDAESGKEALLDAVKSMVESYGKMAIKMVEEELMMRVRMSIIQKTHNKDMVKDEKKHGEDMADTQQDANSLFMGWVKKGFQKLFPQKKKQKKQEEKLEKDSQKEQTIIQQQGVQDQQVLNDTLAHGTIEAKSEMADAAAQIGQQQVETSINQGATQAQADTVLGISSGGAKTISQLGWWGIPLVAVLTALLNGLLQFALSKIGKSSSGSAPTVNTKLASGMLTYDSGNVQEFRGVEDGRSYPVVGSDGKVYAATDGGELATGLVKDPITTIINGQPALVAERGPEMVIGRETTAAMMMARPDIIREIVQFDRNRSGRTYRAYDAGNVQEVAGNIPVPGSDDTQVLTLLRELAPALTAFTAQIRQPLKASINKWGKGGLVDEVTTGQAFMKKYNK